MKRRQRVYIPGCGARLACGVHDEGSDDACGCSRAENGGGGCCFTPFFFLRFTNDIFRLMRSYVNGNNNKIKNKNKTKQNGPQQGAGGKVSEDGALKEAWQRCPLRAHVSKRQPPRKDPENRPRAGRTTLTLPKKTPLFLNGVIALPRSKWSEQRSKSQAQP